MEKQRSCFPRLCPTAAPSPGRKGARKRSPFNARAPGIMVSTARACQSCGQGSPFPLSRFPFPSGQGEKQGAFSHRCGGDGGCVSDRLPFHCRLSYDYMAAPQGPAAKGAQARP